MLKSKVTSSLMRSGRIDAKQNIEYLPLLNMRIPRTLVRDQYTVIKQTINDNNQKLELFYRIQFFEY